MANLPVGRKAGLGLVRKQRRVSRSDQSEAQAVKFGIWLREGTRMWYLTVVRGRMAGCSTVLLVPLTSQSKQRGAG